MSDQFASERTDHINFRAANLREFSGPPMVALEVHEPSFVLIVKPGVGVRRFSLSELYKDTDLLGRQRGKAMGRLHRTHYLRYTSTDGPITSAVDCIDRDYLTVGPTFTLATLWTDGGTVNDLDRHMRRLFLYQQDQERAAGDMARLVERFDLGTVQRVRR